MNEFTVPTPPRATDQAVDRPDGGAIAIRRHEMPFGAHPGEDGVVFHLFAPQADAVKLLIDGAEAVSMERDEAGWHSARSRCAPGARYRYELPDGQPVPVPASRFQPDDAAGAS